MAPQAQIQQVTILYHFNKKGNLTWYCPRNETNWPTVNTVFQGCQDLVLTWILGWVLEKRCVHVSAQQESNLFIVIPWMPKSCCSLFEFIIFSNVAYSIMNGYWICSVELCRTLLSYKSYNMHMRFCLAFFTGCFHAIPCEWSVHHGGSGIKFSILYGGTGFHYLG